MSKKILIANQKGGVGKSTLTFNLANKLKEFAKICIVDLDPQGSIIMAKDNYEIEVYSKEEFDKKNHDDYDFIFIDTPPYLSEDLFNLISEASLILIPTKIGVYDFLAIGKIIDLVKDQGKENKTLIISNMVKPNTTLTAEMNEALNNYGDVNVSKNYISDLVSFTRSSVTAELDNKAQKQIDNLTIEVLNYLT